MAQDKVDMLIAQWARERPDLDASSLAVGIRIEMLAKLLRRDMAESLVHVGLKTWEYDVLSALRRQGAPYELPASELAEGSLLTSGAMTTRIDHLEAQGLVARSPDPEDRRGVRVSLTPKGLGLVDRAVEARISAAESGTGCLTKTERTAVERGLRKLLLALRD